MGPLPSKSVVVQRQDAAASGATSAWGPDALWLSLCNYFMFFSVAKADGSPFAFIPLAKVQFASIEPAHSTFALDGGPDLGPDSGAFAQNSGTASGINLAKESLAESS